MTKKQDDATEDGGWESLHNRGSARLTVVLLDPNWREMGAERWTARPTTPNGLWRRRPPSEVAGCWQEVGMYRLPHHLPYGLKTIFLTDCPTTSRLSCHEFWGEIHLIVESNQLWWSTNYHHTNRELGILFCSIIPLEVTYVILQTKLDTNDHF
jgi:hypothetical protein